MERQTDKRTNKQVSIQVSKSSTNKQNRRMTLIIKRGRDGQQGHRSLVFFALLLACRLMRWSATRKLQAKIVHVPGGPFRIEPIPDLCSKRVEYCFESTVSRVLFWKGELTEFCGKLGEFCKKSR